MKAAYGSFLEGLLVIYCNDVVADVSADKFNVSWTRVNPMVMSVCDIVIDAENYKTIAGSFPPSFSKNLNYQLLF